jgi:hypothetical protein
MILISHRGNLDGPIPDMENTSGYINEALDLGFAVEVDVWKEYNEFWLGHDAPQEKIPTLFLTNEKIWCHAKNISALKDMVEIGIHCFFHDSDDVTLTSRGFLWTFPGKRLTSMSVCVLPERGGFDPNCAGVCSDYILKYVF